VLPACDSVNGMTDGGEEALEALNALSLVRKALPPIGKATIANLRQGADGAIEVRNFVLIG
jgi:hypothetical protein